MKKFITITLIVFSCFQTNIFAQKDNDSLKISGDFGIRGKWQTGNFAQFVINPSASFFFDKGKTSIEARLNYEFLKVNNGSLINDFWSFVLLQYNQSKSIFPMIIAHYGFAQSYAIDQSFISGIGAGFNIIRKSKLTYLQINAFAGYMSLAYENADAHKAPNVGSYIKLKFPIQKERVYFSLDMHTYFSLNHSNFRGFNNRAALHFQILKTLSFSLNYRLIHNNSVPKTINKTNGQLVFGFNYSFNKN